MNNQAVVMRSVEETVVVNAPIGQVYEQWTHIEDFPKFMPAVREMRRIDDARFHWRVERGGREYEATFEVILRIPQRRIAWRTISGSESSGVVCFDPDPEHKTRVTFKMKYTPGAGWDSPSRLQERLGERLKKFKVFMEAMPCVSSTGVSKLDCGSFIHKTVAAGSDESKSLGDAKAGQSVPAAGFPRHLA